MRIYDITAKGLVSTITTIVWSLKSNKHFQLRQHVTCINNMETYANNEDEHIVVLINLNQDHSYLDEI